MSLRTTRTKKVAEGRNPGRLATRRFVPNTTRTWTHLWSDAKRDFTWLDIVKSDSKARELHSTRTEFKQRVLHM